MFAESASDMHAVACDSIEHLAGREQKEQGKVKALMTEECKEFRT